MRLTNNILKTYGAYILCVFALIMGFSSCEDDSDMDLSLAVNSNAIVLDATGGETHIMVYSTDEWHAEFQTPVDWASIDKLNEKGNSSVLLSYAENFGVSRKVVINLTKGDETEEVVVVQKGNINPSLKFEENKYTLSKEELPVRFDIQTNLKYDLDRIEIDVWYDDEISEQWVSDIKLTEEGLYFTALENRIGEDRSARITLKLLYGLDSKYSVYVDVIQTTDEAKAVAEAVINLTKDEVQTVMALDGNIGASLPLSTVTVDYGAASGDWISKLSIFENNLLFHVSENNTGKERRADIVFTIESEGKTYTVKQPVVQHPTGVILVSMDELLARIPEATGELQLTDAIAGLEGIVISDKGNPNMETNPNRTFNTIDFSENLKTAYIQKSDGSRGIRIKTVSDADNLFTYSNKVTLSLNGLTLVKEANPERYTLKDVTAAHIKEDVAGVPSNIVAKEKYISDLTDADIYTSVTLKDVEFAVPYGTYVNLNTGYVLKTDWNTGGITNGGYLDAVPSPVRDKNGDNINLLINASVSWYKNLLPKGSGTLTGIIVHDKLKRFGKGEGDIGRYSIRVLEENDIKMTEQSNSTTLVEWNWIKNGTDISGAGTVNKDASGNVLPAIGTGKLFCTGSTTTGLGNQNIYFPDAASKGAVSSAMHYTASWWNNTANEGEAFVFNFSTVGVNANNLTINFSQGGGSGSEATLHVPANWQIEYSTDGTNYTVLPNSTYTVRPLVVWGKNYDFLAPGLNTYSFKLPTSLLNQSNVFVKLKVQNKICGSKDGAESGTLDGTTNINVRLGFVSFKYSK